MSDATLLPINATDGERAIEAATARLGDVPTPLNELWNANACPESLLPWLAWAVSVDTWDDNWPIDVKRSRVKSSIDIQRHKGTAQSVIDVINSFGGHVELTEWWQQSPPGEPYTFQMTLIINDNGGDTTTASYVDQVIDEVNRAKPVRAHYTFVQGISMDGKIGMIAAARPCTLRIMQFTEAT